MDDLTTARNEIVDINSAAGAKMEALRSIRTAHEDMKTALEIRLNRHEAVDVPKMVTQIQLSDIALQAVYQQISSLRRLSLVNFLR